MSARVIIKILLGMVLFSPCIALAQGYSWTGAGGNSLWSNPNNWTPTGPPTAASPVAINMTGTYTVIVDQTVTIGSLTLGTSGGLGVQSLDTNNQSFTCTTSALVQPTGQLNINGGTVTQGGSPVTLNNLGHVEMAGGTLNMALTNGSTMALRGTCAFTQAVTNGTVGSINILGSASGNGEMVVTNAGTLMTNMGSINLSSEFSGTDARLTVTNGTFDNQTGAVLSAVDPGAVGGTRYLDAALTNAGTILASSAAEIVAANAAHANDGIITAMGSPLTIRQSGAPATFDNNSFGILETTTGGVFTVEGGTFTNSGSIIDPNVKRAMKGVLPQFVLQSTTLYGSLINGSTEVVLHASYIGSGATLDNNARVRILGNVQVDPAATLVNTGTIALEGSSGFPARFTLNFGGTDWTNNGQIDLTSVSADDAILELLGGGILHNNGTLRAQVGGGGGRTITAPIDNQFMLVADTDLLINPTSGNHTNGSTAMVNANSGTLLFEQAAGTTFTNDGTLNTVSGSTLMVRGGQFTSTGAVAKQAGKRAGGVVIFENTTLVNTTLVNATADLVLINSNVDSGSDITNSSYIYVKGLVNWDGNLTNSATGNLVLEGTDPMAGGYGIAHLIFADPVTNSGTLSLTDIAPYGAVFEISAGQQLTNAPGAVIVSQPGTGGSRTLNVELNNQGTVQVDTPLFLNCPANVSHTNSGLCDVNVGPFTVEMTASSTLTNTGTISVDPATQLIVNNGNFNQMGTLSVSAVRAGKLPGPPSVVLTNLAFEGSYTNDTVLNLVGVTLGSTATLVNNGQLICNGTNQIDGTLTLTSFGVVDVVGNGTNGMGVLNLGLAVTNDGTMNLTDVSGEDAAVTSFATLTNNGDIVTQSGGGGSRTLTLPLVNTGTLTVGAPTVLNLTSADGTNNGLFEINHVLDVNLGSVQTFTNNSMIEIPSSGGMYVYGPGTFNAASGTIDSGVVVARGGPGTLSLADLTVLGTLSTDVTLNLRGNTFAAGSALDNNGSAVLNGTNTFNGSLVNQSGADMAVLGDITYGNAVLNGPGFNNFGTLTLDSPVVGAFAAVNVSGPLVNQTTGQIFAAGTGGGAAQEINGVLDNQGQVNVNYSLHLNTPDGDHTNTGSISVNPGHQLTVTDTVAAAPQGRLVNLGALGIGLGGAVNLQDSALDNQFVNPQRGVVFGEGTVNAMAGTFTSDGAITPGFSPGVLNVSGNLTLQAANVMTVEVNGPTAGTDYDQLNITGTFTAAGSLAVSIGGTPAEGDIFTIVNAGAVSGTFGSVVGGEVGNGLVLQPVYTATTVELHAVPGGVKWINPAGGLWSNAANWSTGQVPNACSLVDIDLDGTYEVTLDVSVEVWSLNIGAATGLQTLNTAGHSVGVQDASQIGTNGRLLLNGGSFDASFTTCLDTPGLQALPGLPSLANSGVIDVRNNASINVSFGNGSGGVVNILGSGGNPTSLWSQYGVVNDGDINLGDDGTGGDAALQLISGVLINNGTLNSRMDTSGERTILAPLDNHGSFQVGVATHVDPVQIPSLDRVKAFLAADDDTLALYRFDEGDGETAFDTSAFDTPLTLVGTEVVEGVFGAARRFDGQDDYLALEALRGRLAAHAAWTLSWFSKTVDGLPALTPYPELFGGAGDDQTDTWHLFALAWDGTRLQAYRDGLPLDGVDVDSDRFPWDRLTFGRDGDLYQPGVLDALRIDPAAPAADALDLMVDVAAAAADWSTRARINDPGGVRQLWVDACPVAVLGEQASGIIVHGRMLGDQPAGKVHFVTHDGTTGQVLDGTFKPDPDQPDTWMLTGRRTTNKGLTPDFNNYATTHLLNGAMLVIDGGVLYNFGTLSGSGLLDVGSAALESNGTIAPGASPGLIEVSGNAVLGSTSSIDIEIGGTTPGSLYDRFAVSGSLTIDGTVNVSFIPGYNPAGTEQFDVVTYGTSTGVFSAVNLPPNPPDVALVATPGFSSLVIEAQPVFQFSFNPPTYTVREDDGLVAAILSITVERVGNPLGDGQVVVGTVDTGSATEGVDYVALNQTLNFLSGTTLRTVDFAVIDDRLIEGNESLELHLTAPVGGTLGNDVATVTIEDVEEGEIGFSAPLFTFAENLPTADLVLTRTGGSNGAVSVTFNTVSGTAMAGQDFMPLITVVNWNDGETTPKTVSVPLIDDNILEGDESFTATVSNPTGNVGIGAGSTEVVIDDYETGVPSFTSEVYSVAENQAQAAITIERLGGTDGPLLASMLTIAGTATAGTDYTAVDAPVTFGDGDAGPITITIPILDDAVYEGDETVTLGIAVAVPLGAPILSAVLTIVDDELPVGDLQFTANSYTFNETAGTADIEIVRVNGSGGTVGATFETFDNEGGATPGVDYTPTTTTVTFPAGTTSQIVSVPILKDGVAEPDEAFGIRIHTPTGGAGLGIPNIAGVVIADNDDPPGTIQLVSMAFSAGEGDGTVAIGVERTGGTGGQVGVAFTTVPSGSAVPGQDYQATQTVLTWADGVDGIQTVNVPLINDTAAEPTETFNVVISTPTGGAALGLSSGTVSILDDDPNGPGNLHLRQDTFFVRESERFLVFNVLRDGGSAGAVSVRVATTDGTAHAGTDYTAVDTTVTFQPFDTTPKTIMIPIIDDAAAEGLEDFFISLSAATGGATVGTPGSARVFLRDDENQAVRWASSGQTRGESNSTHELTAVLDTVAANPITVGVEVVGLPDSATRDVDYTLSADSLTFPAGANVATLTLTLLDDALVEGTERVQLRLTAGDVPLGTPNLYTFTISDNDTARLRWSSIPGTLQEGRVAVNTPVKTDTGFSLTASLSAPLQNGGTFAVNLGGTAQAGLDYRAPLRQVTFAPGATTADIQMTLVDDQAAEATETLTLTLVGGGQVTTAADAAVTLNIRDDDRPRARVTWAETGTRVIEDDIAKRSVSVSVQAVLNVVFDQPVTVNYSVGGLATPGVDHTLTPGSLTFPAGQTSAFLTFEVLGDLLYESSENIAIRLTGGDVAPGGNDTFTVTIRDNDIGQVPDTVINVVAPTTLSGNVLQVKTGETMTLTGAVPEPQVGLTYGFFWEICLPDGCPQFEGENLAYAFDAPGTYRVTCFARDDNGNADPTPAQLLVQVRDNIPPSARILSPARRNLVLPVGTIQEFTAEAADVFKRDVVATRWFFTGGGASVAEGTATYTHEFDTVGTYTLVFEAVDEQGAKASAFRNIQVYEGTPPEVIQIAEPANHATFQVGETVHCVAQALTPGTKRGHLRWVWDLGDGSQIEGEDTEWVYDTPGRYQMRLFAYDDQGNRVGRDLVNLNVVDPDGLPEVTFGFPTGMRLEPGGGKRAGGCLYLNAIVLDDKGYEDLSFVYDVPGGRFNHETPGLVCFDEPGEYLISMYAVTPSGMQSDVVTRTLTVKAGSDAEFEPNNDFFEAPTLRPGTYRNLTLDEDDPDDYYRVTVPGDGQRLVLKADVDGETYVDVMTENGEMVGDTHVISASGNINLTGLKAGDYVVHLYQPDTAKRRGLSLSLSIGVLNPALYFPDIRSTSDNETSIGIVNPANEAVCLEAVGYAADGTILDEIPLELEARGRRHYDVEELFGDLADEVVWVQVDAVGELLGYARTAGRDRRDVYAVTAGRELRSELHVPHIAEKTDQWFTRAAVVNGGAVAATAKVDIPADSRNLVLNTGFTQDAFEFIDRFDGSFPPGNLWANFQDQNDEPNLAGVEVFGTLDGSRVTAGLELSDVRRDNPNFTFVQNNLYFTHIADVDSFYTGIALVNLGDFEQGVLLRTFDADGLEVGSLLKIIAGGDKLLTTADLLIAEMPPSERKVAWMLAEADADITGFELFGTYNGKQLAGLEASRALKPQICFPFLDTDQEVAHGISVVNVNDVPVTLTLTLYSNNGAVLGTVQQDLAARQKFLGILTQLFPNLDTAVPGWMEASTEVDGKPLAGFELFLNIINNDQMGAVIAQ